MTAYKPIIWGDPYWPVLQTSEAAYTECNHCSIKPGTAHSDRQLPLSILGAGGGRERLYPALLPEALLMADVRVQNGDQFGGMRSLWSAIERQGCGCKDA